MLNIRDISIKNKLVLMQVFTSVVVLGLCFAAFIVTDITGYKERKIQSMASLARLIASNSVSAIVFLDNDAANIILTDLKKITPEVLHAEILDKKGNIFAAYSKDGNDTFRFNYVTSHDEKYEFTGNQLVVYNNIVSNNEEIGTVCLQVELSELAAIKSQKYQIASILLIVGIGLAFLIALSIQPYISRRLLYLVAAMKQVSKTGNYSKHVLVEGKDEITDLSLVFNDLMDQILESHNKKDEFIGIASHELKTPLTSIKAYLQVLEGIEVKQPNKQYILKANENVNKLQQLLLDLLDVSKIQSGQLELTISEFDIDSLIDETIASFQIISPGHTITRGGSRVDRIIKADRQRIEQVLINILSNAIKYSPAADKVIVYTGKTDVDLMVSVKDFGLGIPKDDQNKIFERFYRTKDFSRHHISGFGLGLYICNDIIKRHKGKIWVESNETGSIFCFTLPLEPAFINEPLIQPVE